MIEHLRKVLYLIGTPYRFIFDRCDHCRKRLPPGQRACVPTCKPEDREDATEMNTF
jgi:hypothetical protein